MALNSAVFQKVKALLTGSICPEQCQRLQTAVSLTIGDKDGIGLNRETQAHMQLILILHVLFPMSFPIYSCKTNALHLKICF